MWFDPITAGLLRSPFHALVSHNTMLITVRGRKTGRRLTTPVNYRRRGDDLLTVSLRSRTWWRNVRGGGPVEVLLEGKKREALASVLESDADVTRGLTEIVAHSPSYARALAIGLDETGRPKPPDLAQACRKHVVVRSRLQPHPL